MHPSDSLSLPALKTFSLHGRAVLFIAGVWDHCKLNLPAWETRQMTGEKAAENCFTPGEPSEPGRAGGELSLDVVLPSVP